MLEPEETIKQRHIHGATVVTFRETGSQLSMAFGRLGRDPTNDLALPLVEGQINWNMDSERQGEGWGVMERE